MIFADAARRLAGIAGAGLHWTPGQFWDATPDELATIFEALAGDALRPPDGDALARLKEIFPDG